MDTKTLVHAGLELVVIAGLSFWMKKRVDAVDERVDVIDKMVAGHHDALQKFQQILMTHENMIRKMSGVPPLVPLVPQPPQPTTQEDKSEKKGAKGKSKGRSKKGTEETLDDLLQTELKELADPPTLEIDTKGKPEEENIEIINTDDYGEKGNLKNGGSNNKKKDGKQSQQSEVD